MDVVRIVRSRQNDAKVWPMYASSGWSGYRISWMASWIAALPGMG